MSDPSASKQGDLSGLRIDRGNERPRAHHRGTVWTIVILVLIGGGIFAWKSRHTSAPFVRTVIAVRSIPGQGRAVLTASAYLISRNRSTIGAKVPGRLQRILVEEGSRVKAGDLIAELDSLDYQAHRNEARANLADARRELERQNNLLASGAGTQQKVDEQQTRLEVYEAQLDLAEVNLQNTKIFAPFDGVILQKQAEIGEMISPGVVSGAVSSGSIAVLGSTEIEVEADVNESNLSKVSVEQEAEIVLDAFPGKRFHGKIRLIEPRADRQKSVVQARVSILDPDDSLRPEMGAKVTFLSSASEPSSDSDSESVVLVPSDAVVRMGSGDAVFLLEGETARLRPVEISRTEGAQTVLRKGLSGGETVILSPSSEIRDGLQVRIQTP